MYITHYSYKRINELIEKSIIHLIVKFNTVEDLFDFDMGLIPELHGSYENPENRYVKTKILPPVFSVEDTHNEPPEEDIIVLKLIITDASKAELLVFMEKTMITCNVFKTNTYKVNDIYRKSYIPETLYLKYVENILNPEKYPNDNRYDIVKITRHVSDLYAVKEITHKDYKIVYKSDVSKYVFECLLVHMVERLKVFARKVNVRLNMDHLGVYE